jgi:2-polyprenyl-3-methyl-5-hydroxy-6-metoxy-1,4-benzoquinol methylase
VTRPSHLNQANADAFLDRGVARLYRHRPAYPPDAIAFIAGLAIDAPRRVLDLGCGTGFIARPLAPLVDGVDAVDPSSAMIDEGRSEPGGDHPAITWINDAAESVELSGPYSLVVAGESLHWMHWQVVLPNCARLLTPRGRFAIAGVNTLRLPWDDELRAIVAGHSVVQDYTPFDLVAALEQEGLFRRRGEHTSAPSEMVQSIDDYIDSFHARSSLARHRMGVDGARAFDDDVRALLARHDAEAVRRTAVATITYGTLR